jgi:hypothetical protein
MSKEREREREREVCKSNISIKKCRRVNERARERATEEWRDRESRWQVDKRQTNETFVSRQKRII